MAPEVAQISKIWARCNEGRIRNQHRNFIVCDCSIHTVWGIAHAGGRSGILLYLLRTVDCSKSAVAESLGQKVVLSFNGYWEKGQSNLWLNPSMLPILGSMGIQLGTCK